MPFGIGGSSGSSDSGVVDFQAPLLERVFQEAQIRRFGALQNLQTFAPLFRQQVQFPSFDAFSQLVQGSAGQNPYLEQQVQSGVNSLNENFTENILPALRRGATASAGFGASSAARGQLAEANAAGELLEAQQNFETGLRGNAFNTQLGAQLQALAQAPNLLNLYTGAANAPFSTLIANRQVLGPAITESGSNSSSFSLGF